MKDKKSLFITFEGCEGAGKTTHCQLLGKYLKNKGFDILLTREPGGTKLAKSLRAILLHPESKMTPLSELFLYEAARAQDMAELILPALKEGKIVICDRSIDTTVAYQGYARKLDIPLINKLNGAASRGLKPNLTIYLDVNPYSGLNRAKKLDKESYGESGDRMERESIKFHTDVRKGFLAQAKKNPKRIKVIKTQKNIEDTQELIRKTVDKILDKK
jgi:dTMP kinase